MIRDDDNSSALFFTFVVEANLLYSSGTQCFCNESPGVVIPLNDVDLLTFELIDYLANTRTAGSNTGTDRIHVVIVGRHSDLRAVTCLSSDGLDLDVSVDQLGDLEFEECPDEFRVTTRHNDLWALAFSSYLENPRLDTVASFEPLVGDLLGSGKYRFGISEIKNRVPMIGLLDDARHQVAFAPVVQLEDLLAFRVAQPLQDDLFGCLCGDSPEILRSVGPLVRDVSVFVEFLAVDHYLAGIGVDGDPGFLCSSGGTFVGRNERVGERLEDGVAWDTLFAFQHLERIHEVVIHRVSYASLPGRAPFSHTKTVRADDTSSYRNFRLVPSMSIVKPTSSAVTSAPVWFLSPSIAAKVLTLMSRPIDLL